MKVPLSIFLKIAVRTPDVFLATALETLRSRTARFMDYRFGNGRALPPRYIDVKMTNRCNLRCRMCGQWGTQGIYRDAPAEALRQEMDLPTLKALVDDVAPFRPLFYLWGGEPFLYADLLPFLAHLRKRRLVYDQPAVILA